MSAPFFLRQGRTPLLISMPHVGSEIPAELYQHYQPRALLSEDTDWHLERLYGGLADELGASLIVPRYSRYLIDLNRPPEDTPMYPGAANTELCPTRFFTGEPLYRPDQAPDAAEQQRRLQHYWLPYHRALTAEMQRMKRLYGRALLFDAHSIRSELPWLFEGRLPQLNLGTVDGRSCDAAITATLGSLLSAQPAFSCVVNGRFKGGFITRHYGQPDAGQHAVQLEMCQCCYMHEEPAAGFREAYDEALAVQVQPLLRELLGSLLAWRPRASTSAPA